MKQLPPTPPTTMSANTGRLIFVFFLVVNCILWSRGRYGQPIYASLLQSDTSLVKRISYELSQPQGTDIYVNSLPEATIPFIGIHPLLSNKVQIVSTTSIFRCLAMSTCSSGLSIAKHRLWYWSPPPLLLHRPLVTAIGIRRHDPLAYFSLLDTWH